MTQINLLPWREQSRKEKQKRFGIIALCFVGLGLFFTVFFHMHYSYEINLQNKRNAMLRTTLDEESSGLMSLNKQKRELLDVDNQLHFIYSLRESSYQAVKMLNELVVLSPDAVTLYKVVRIGRNVSLYGKAKSNLQITLFMENIDKSKIFDQPVLTEISGKESDTGEVRNFELKLLQTE